MTSVMRPPHQSPYQKTAACAGILLAVNAVASWRLFFAEYLVYLGSIDAAYIALGRYVIEHPWDLSWFPLWYGGVPYENTYPPLMHIVVAIVAWLGGLSPALSHHIVGAAAYCLGAVTLFALAYRLSRDRLTSVVAALVYSLVSPAALLIGAVAGDLGTAWGPRRLHALVVYGEGPHIVGLALLPLAVVALDRALEKPKPARIYLAALAMAALPLTNWIGAFGLALAIAAYLLARAGQGWGRRTVTTVAIAGLAYAMAAPWTPPSLLATIQHNAQHVVGRYPLGWEHLVYAAGVIVVALGLALFLIARKVPFTLRFSILFLAPLAIVTLAAEWGDLYMMPQPERYHIEMEMPFAMLAAFTLVPLLRRLTRAKQLMAAGMFVIAGLVQLQGYWQYAKDMIRSTDTEQMVEYEVARWLDENLPGRRVFATGSTQFWLNVFADNPQIGGGFAQGIHNRQIPQVHFGVPYTISDGANTVLWLKAYGVRAIVVSGPKTRDSYQDYRDPGKFEGVLPEVWRSGDDAIYEVRQRSDSLARVVSRKHVVERPPYNNDDVESIIAYVDALEDDALPVAEIEWRRPHEGLIQADLRPSHLVSLQISHHPGWRAWVNGQPRQIERDGLGFMLMEPKCDGPCVIELTYDGGREMALAKFASGAALVFGVLWFGYDCRRKPAA